MRQGRTEGRGKFETSAPHQTQMGAPSREGVPCRDVPKSKKKVFIFLITYRGSNNPEGLVLQLLDHGALNLCGRQCVVDARRLAPQTGLLQTRPYH